MISKIKLDFYSHTKSYIEFRNIRYEEIKKEYVFFLSQMTHDEVLSIRYIHFAIMIGQLREHVWEL